jgi:hypothetical protein
LNIEEGVVLEPNGNRINRYHPVVLEQRTITAAKTTFFKIKKMYNRKLMFAATQNYID